MAEDLKIGDVVRLKGRKRQAKVTRLSVHIEGGVCVEPALAGNHYWNEQDLELVSAGDKR